MLTICSEKIHDGLTMVYKQQFLSTTDLVCRIFEDETFPETLQKKTFEAHPQGLFL